MMCFLLAFTAFAGFIATHVLACRWRAISPRLFPAFFLSLAWLGLLAAALRNASWPASSAELYCLLSLVYLNELVVLGDRSPSLEILRLVRGGPPGGLGREDLERRFDEARWIEGRLGTLERDGYVACRGDRHVLQPRARIVVRFIQAYRSLIRRGSGG